MLPSLRRAEAIVAALLTLASAWLHLILARTAGPMWRDEANTIAVSTLPTVRDIWTNLQFDSFPLLWLLVVRAFSGLVGPMNDPGFRTLGFFIGLTVLGVLWFNARSFGHSFPLLSVALLGLTPAVVVWGDSMRAYGLGLILILLTCGLLWRFIEKPTLVRFVLVTVTAVASVHSLFYNAVVLLALCAAAAGVCARRRTWKTAGVVILIGAISAASMIPYLVAFSGTREWRMLVQMPEYTFGWFWTMLSETLRPGGFIAIMIWVELFAFALVVGLQIARSEKRFALSDRQRDVALYALVILAVATPALFFFLKALAYFTSPWYYLALLAIAAVCIDTIFGAVCQTRVTRICRLAVVLVFVATTYPLALTAVEMRMTNIDLIAATVETTASRGDLIVVSPWYVGISFGRYYSGDVPWMTMPPIGSPKYHRYDLVKPKMVMADQTAAVRPVVEAAAEALRNGGKVFVVGDFRYPPNGQQPTVLPPAPIPGHGWPTVTYDQQWSAMLGSFLRDNAATIETVSITGLATVNSNEEPDLRVARGWRPSAAGTPGPQVDVTRAPAAVPSSPDSPGPAPRRGGATSSTLPASSGMHP